MQRRGTQRKGLGVAMIAAGLFAAATVRAITPATPMTSVPGGTFPMGCDSSRASERPRHLVRVAAFAVDATEVTARDYEACVISGGCKPSGTTTGDTTLCNDARTRPNHPANCVDWNDAHTFCAWAGKRLPSEEEWEYAARGDDDRAYPWGDASPTTTVVNALGDGDGFAGTSPVGSYDAGRSPFGVYDMAGNVWEWTESAWSDDYASPREYDLKVVRGGGFGSASPALLRATARGSHRIGFRDAHLGFRCAK
jgi:formylglycine-generating enzyme required for sulfatase activity